MVLVLNLLLFHFVSFHLIISFSSFDSFQRRKHLNYKHKFLVWKTTWNIKGKTKSNKLFFSQRITAMSYNNDKVIIIIVIVSYGWSSNWLVLFGSIWILFSVWYLDSVFSLIFGFCFQFHTLIPMFVFVFVCFFFGWKTREIRWFQNLKKYRNSSETWMNQWIYTWLTYLQIRPSQNWSLKNRFS